MTSHAPQQSGPQTVQGVVSGAVPEIVVVLVFCIVGGVSVGAAVVVEVVFCVGGVSVGAAVVVVVVGAAVVVVVVVGGVAAVVVVVVVVGIVVVVVVVGIVVVVAVVLIVVAAIRNTTRRCPHHDQDVKRLARMLFTTRVSVPASFCAARFRAVVV